MTQQLILNLKLAPEATFSNFYNAAAQPIVELLLHQKEPRIYLYGPTGVGKSHLLQAACHAATAANLRCTYLSLQQVLDFDPSVLQGLENLSLVALDDLTAIAQNPLWEEALFHFYNRLLTSNTRVLMAAPRPPAEIGYVLPDLISRLQAMLVLAVPATTDTEKLAALQMHAKARGLLLSEEVGQFLLNRVERNMRVLCDLLDQIDSATLAAQRKLTIPFLKHLYGW